MRAITVNQYGATPALTEVPDPQPEPGQVLIRVEAAGMNPMDQVIARLEASPALLARLPEAVVNGGIVMPPITCIELDDVPALNGTPHAGGKTVITFGDAS